MFDRYFGERACEGNAAAEPFVDDNSQGVLIAGGSRVSLNLFGGHVGDCAYNLLRTLEARTLHDDGYAEIAQENFVAPPDEHVFGLDVAVDEFFVVGVL